MKRVFFIGVALLFTVFAGSVFAQDAAVVTLTEQAAVDYALKNSHQLKSGAIDLEIKKRADDNSWNTFLPGVTLSGTASRANEVSDTMGSMMGALAPLFGMMGQPVPTSPDPIEDDHWRMVGNIGISWNFSAAMLVSMKATHADYEAGLITWEQTLKQTERDVRKMFYGMLLAQESLKLNEDSLENARSRADQTQANYRNGRAPELSLLQAQVAYENKKPEVLKAQQTLEKNLDTFALLLGMDAGTKIRLEGSISPEYLDLNAEQLVQKNLSSRLDMQSLAKNIEILSINKKALDLSSYTPALQLSWGWQPVSSVPALKDSDVKWADKWSDGGSLSITLAWNLTNLLPWSAQRQQAKDLTANISKLRLSSKALTDQATSEITALVKSLELSRSQIEAMQRNIDLAQRAYDMTQASYRNGTTELLDVRDAENSLNQAKLGLLSEQYNYLSGVLDLEYAVNAKLGK